MTNASRHHAPQKIECRQGAHADCSGEWCACTCHACACDQGGGVGPNHATTCPSYIDPSAWSGE